MLGALVPSYACAIPTNWLGPSTLAAYKSIGRPLRVEPFDKRNPPVFEGQAQYLQRHGLLAAHEAERADFNPETLPRQYWPD